MMREARSARRSEGGFTFIELMVVLAIIGILAAAAVPAYKYTVRSAREKTLMHNLKVLRDVINQFKADRMKYPTSLEELVEGGYLREIPADPVTESAETWIPVYAEPDPDDPNADSGIEDVQSGAEGETLDGVPYGEL